MSEWTFERYKEAYKEMAQRAKYRPMSPGDGLGSCDLTEWELRDPVRLDVEAEKYAAEFYREDDECVFTIGCSNGTTNKAFVYTIEAARALCGGFGREDLAKDLLKMALAEIERARREEALQQIRADLAEMRRAAE
jgi:hypothetical protein